MDLAAATSGLQSASQFLGAVAGASAVSGVAAMAVVELAKDFFPLRRGFQRRWIVDTCQERVEHVNKNRSGVSAKVELRTVLGQLEKLAGGGDPNALYSLPTEQLAGQLSAAAQVVLDNPTAYEDLLWVLSKGCDPHDVEKLIRMPRHVLLGEEESSQPQPISTLLGKGPGVGAGVSPADERSERRRKVSDAIDLRTRIAHQIERNLDGVQIAISKRWRLWLQLAALVASFAIILLTLAASSTTGMSKLQLALLTLIGGLLSGFMATVARDVVAVVQGLRRRS
jgi:hypothetical protein